MINLEHKLTVDDLIVEYMLYKVLNGYEPSFLTSEFMSFLQFFESKMEVEDSLYENFELFKRFFERKCKYDWVKPHMEMVCSEEDNDYLIIANYKLNFDDKIMLNTYFMSNNISDNEDFMGKAFKIRWIIGKYLSTQPKRKIDENTEIDDSDLIIGKHVAAGIISIIWDRFTHEQTKKHKWPRQCYDINKFLFEIDLAEIIGVESIKNELLEFYKVVSKRVAILYHQDRNFQGYEKIMDIATGIFGHLNIDSTTLKFIQTHEIGGPVFLGEDSDITTVTTVIESENVKKLVRSLETSKQNN